MMKFKHAMMHIKEHYPIVYKHWPKKFLRQVCAEIMWLEKYGFVPPDRVIPGGKNPVKAG